MGYTEAVDPVMPLEEQPSSVPPIEQGISLDELAQAFAQVMGTVPKPRPERPADEVVTATTSATKAAADAVPAVGSADDAADTLAPPSTEADDDACCPLGPLSILESMLFVGDRDNRPLTPARAAELLRGVQADEIPSLVDQLNRRYHDSGSPFYVANEGDGYRMTLREAFNRLRDKFYGRLRQARLSQAAIEVLAIIAYQQPLSAEQIARLRGKPNSHVLSQLVHRGLLRIERQPGKRRIALYYTTDRFMQLFGLTTLADLPQSEELDRQ